MSVKNAKTVEPVVKAAICCGCGACYSSCPKSCITFNYGKRFNYPIIDKGSCTSCGRCLSVCPSAFLLKGTKPEFNQDGMSETHEHWMIHATDQNVRIDAASGGFCTGTILSMMKSGHCNGGIVSRTDANDPLVSETIIASTPEDVISGRGSRYAPVSSCAALKDHKKHDGSYVFIGCPCHVQAVENMMKYDKELRSKIKLTIALICLGMASRSSTRSFLKRYNADMSKIRRIAYRGNGWPGSFTAYGENDEIVLRRPLFSYIDNKVVGDSLRYLVPRDHYLRCGNCLDHWGLYGDISVCDPWCHDMIVSEKIGKTAIVIRTERGREAINAVVKNGDMERTPLKMQDFFNYQKTLVRYMVQTRESWMQLHQFFFFGRIPNLFKIAKHKAIGLKSVLKARLNRDYYNSPEIID